jgi:hypothetical protein
MVFARQLRDGVRRGRIRCTVRIWKALHVKVGNRYPMEDGHVVVDSIASITTADITDALARESGFASAADLLKTANHGGGQQVYLIRFHYLPPGAWEVTPDGAAPDHSGTTLLQRIRRSTAPAARRRRKT